MQTSALAAAAQPPIGDHGLIGDCRTAALVSRDGAIDWLCLPDCSAPSIFAAILDEASGGSFAVRPREEYQCARRYRPGTCVLETTFRTSGGEIRLTDALTVVDSLRTLQPMRELLRVIECTAGAVELDVRVDPRPHYGSTSVQPSNGGPLGWRYAWQNELLSVHSEIALEPHGTALTGATRIARGERRCISLAYVRGDPAIIPPLGEGALRRLEQTTAWWRSWSDQCVYAGEHRDAVLRSALTLKALCFSLSGAILAAPTTSLPEAIGGERNWDYRFCWLRDAGLTMQALTDLGFHREAGAFLVWLLHTTWMSWPELQIFYDEYGRDPGACRKLDHLSGYRGSRPVRVGNTAWQQRQLDVYGEVVLAAYAFIDAGGVIDPVEARRLVGLGRAVIAHWREADNGIWEIPDPRRQYVFPKVMCWMALDRLLRLGERGVVALGSFAEELGRTREAIAVLIDSDGFNPELGSYVSELGGDHADAALLLMPRLGFRAASDPRMRGTYDFIARRLGHGGLLDRYEPGYDGFAGREGAFGICSFWAVDHLARRGDVAEAERLFERLLGLANDIGLFGEEIDAGSGAALGNFPQGFTHIGLINAAIAIERARREA